LKFIFFNIYPYDIDFVLKQKSTTSFEKKKRFLRCLVSLCSWFFKNIKPKTFNGTKHPLTLSWYVLGMKLGSRVGKWAWIGEYDNALEIQSRTKSEVSSFQSRLLLRCLGFIPILRYGLTLDPKCLQFNQDFRGWHRIDPNYYLKGELSVEFLEIHTYNDIYSNCFSTF